MIYFIFLLPLLSTYVTIRNQLVYSERSRVIDFLAKKGREAIASGAYSTNYFEPLNTITYGEMMWKFWKPVKSFFNFEG